MQEISLKIGALSKCVTSFHENRQHESTEVKPKVFITLWKLHLVYMCRHF